MSPSNEALDTEQVVEWLGTVADTSAKGAIVDEMELPGGGWIVSEEWPSRVDYLKYARERHAIEAMVDLDRQARAEDARYRRRR